MGHLGWHGQVGWSVLFSCCMAPSVWIVRWMLGSRWIPLSASMGQAGNVAGNDLLLSFSLDLNTSLSLSYLFRRDEGCFRLSVAVVLEEISIIFHYFVLRMDLKHVTSWIFSIFLRAQNVILKLWSSVPWWMKLNIYQWGLIILGSFIIMWTCIKDWKCWGWKLKILKKHKPSGEAANSMWKEKQNQYFRSRIYDQSSRGPRRKTSTLFLPPRYCLTWREFATFSILISDFHLQFVFV